MKILPAALLALAFPFATALGQSDQFPPAAHIVQDDFSPMKQPWVVHSGVWVVSNGAYVSTFGDQTDISRITSYRDVHPAGPPSEEIGFEEYTYTARVRNQGTDDSQSVGIVYGYKDQNNYYEVILSAAGNVRIRSTLDGVFVDERQDPVLAGIPRNTWCELKVHWKQGVAIVSVNGQKIFPVQQPEFTSGQVGLVTHNTIGRFDGVSLTTPFGDQPFFETFTPSAFTPPVQFDPISGQWAVVNGMLKATSIQETNVVLAPINTGLHPGLGDTFDYTFRTRMVNGFANSGNLVGIVFNYQTTAYSEVVFSPTGVARLNRFENGETRTIAEATYNGARNVPFDVTLENGPNNFGVFVDGKNLFPDVIIVDINPVQVPEGNVGLITHWAPGRFDNISFDHGFSRPCTFDGEEVPPFSTILSGTWSASDGTLNSTAVGNTDLIRLPCASSVSPGTEKTLHARLLNEFGAAGNLVGLVYDHQGSGLYEGDYFEIVFSPTGSMQLNKVIQGVKYPVRTRSHTIPRNTWFDVDVIRNGIFTTVKLNGETVLENEPQGDLPGGSIGLVTHWTRGRFDDVSVTERVLSPP
jgi:hypothetical protein